jgi:putative peptidoglycan lipid II flippase
LAEAVAGWINTVLLLVTLLRRGHLTWEWALARRTGLLLVSSGVMGGVIVYLLHRWEPLLSTGSSLVTKTGILTVLIVISMAVYFFVAFLIGGVDVSMIRRNLNRKPPAAKPAGATAADDKQP